MYVCMYARAFECFENTISAWTGEEVFNRKRISVDVA